MCVVSMIMDHYHDKWLPYVHPTYQPPPVDITQKEVEELRKLLKRAKEYDERTGQKDCELEDKKRRIKDLADQLGVKVDFL